MSRYLGIFTPNIIFGTFDSYIILFTLFILHNMTRRFFLCSETETSTSSASSRPTTKSAEPVADVFPGSLSLLGR
jgi:hypothetical protein